MKRKDIQCNTDSCYEHIPGGSVYMGIYIYMGVPVYGPLNVLCVCVCMSMCVFVCERDIKSELSYTCTNDHLYKMATCLRQSVLSPSKQILIKLLLYKTITCLTRPATTCFVHQMKKKNCIKQPLPNLTQQRNGKQT